ncbi:lupus la ribonucleoprotein, putative [Perkinsus marinus ATCC 50983]|uniref:Lupus la ribonucleoprotein, putative n=1 Tax=Perkinsus marinus (strain ATCC 50983 / TXsc) TaxID=423536 RepID=C5L0V6_PERM5|nr:lupus la ribonucleoprotein, putative [Perkinsus marinus ATCC 50983]EER09598.1 lupus la ribonucleoprotein, putative [Perkinsus marinus ATCC 50983]|eukprot:XP_002777803.1 lupus la ribonucleoprotein, putative [Perkinsus marinus ATCC 50983]
MTTTEATATKRPPSEEPTEATSPKKQKTSTTEQATTGPAVADVKRQVEYYLSDDNLRHDAFFHRKISEDPEGWLPADLVLSCNKMKQMHCTAENIEHALAEGSHLELKKDNDKLFIRRTTPLPTLSAPKGKKGPAGRSQLKNVTVHDGGVVVAVRDIPEEVEWPNIKKSLEEIVKDKVDDHEGNVVTFATSVDKDKRSCYVLMKPFDDDVQFFSDLKFKVTPFADKAAEAAASKAGEEKPEGEKAEASASTEETPKEFELKTDVVYGIALKDALKRLPAHVLRKRESRAKDRARSRNKPIMLGTQRYNNVQTANNRVRDVLRSRKAGQELKQGTPDYELIEAVLKFHPSAERKLAGMTGIKVDVSPYGETHCFYVMRGNGESEDISVVKCFNNMQQNPPYLKEDEAAVKKEAAPAEEKSS